MNLFSRIVGITFCCGVVASIAACSAPTEDADADETLGTVRSAAYSCPSCDPEEEDDLPAGSCPGSSVTTAQKITMQKKVTAAMRYLLGGSSPSCSSGTLSHL